MQARPHSAFHFQPPGWAVAITIIYPLPRMGAPGGGQPSDGQMSRSSEASQLAETRAQLHSCLGLPGGPCFPWPGLLNAFLTIQKFLVATKKGQP